MEKVWGRNYWIFNGYQTVIESVIKNGRSESLHIKNLNECQQRINKISCRETIILEKPILFPALKKLSIKADLSIERINPNAQSNTPEISNPAKQTNILNPQSLKDFLRIDSESE